MAKLTMRGLRNPVATTGVGKDRASRFTLPWKMVETACGLHSPRSAIHRQMGFTIAELIAIIVIAGILATFAAPRFFVRSEFDSRSFYDQVISTLRYAQKAAIAQRRFVCVAFTANSVTLTTGATAACGINLAGPAGQSPYFASSSNASFTATPAAFNFDALGRASVAQNITVSGYAIPITVESETGYVH